MTSVSFDPDSVVLPAGHRIGGEIVPQSDGITLHRPSDGIAYAECPVADAALVDRAVAAARTALRSSGWADMRPRERARLMHRWADLIEANRFRIARLEAIASTRPITQLLKGDVQTSADQIRFFAEMADKEGGEVVPTAAGQLGMILTEPYGVVGAITPWNFPLNMAAWKLGPALAAGNAVVLKPSEMTPFSTLLLADLAHEAGIPGGIVNIVLGDGQTTGAAITGHPDIAKISFTGSTQAGQAIMRNVASTGIKPMTLELGGKSPQIVFHDADLELAAACIARSMTSNAGQVCAAGSRLIVDATVAEALAERVMRLAASVRPGPTWDEATTYSPIISQRQIDRVADIVSRSRAQGARCLGGGEVMARAGYFYSPTLLGEVHNDNPAVVEEIFGPVLTLQTFTDEDEALMLADHPTYGLAAGIYTRDLSRAIRVTKALKTGTAWVNRYGRSPDHALPTGGYKSSGIGKDLGREAYRANRQQKSVLIDL